MTKNDHKKIAQAIADARPPGKRYTAEWETWFRVSGSLADMLVKDNPMFDHERFEAATLD